MVPTDAGEGPPGLVLDEFRRARTLLVVAHPDDEVIGAGAHLPCWPQSHLLYVTDGAPRNLLDASRAGFSSRESYATTRRTEAERAMAMAGIPSSQIHCLDFVDQETSLALVSLSLRLHRLFQQLRPEIVLTQPYEGGHPDHDATAFAVHSARRILEREGCCPPNIIEVTSYHNHGGYMATGHFLPHAGCSVTTCALAPEQREVKRKLFDCFVTQHEVLRYFPIECERFRPAPIYDFSRLPHPGTLYYELFDWGMTGTRWCELAGEALQELGLPPRVLSQIGSIPEGV